MQNVSVERGKCCMDGRGAASIPAARDTTELTLTGRCRGIDERLHGDCALECLHLRRAYELARTSVANADTKLDVDTGMATRR